MRGPRVELICCVMLCAAVPASAQVCRFDPREAELGDKLAHRLVWRDVCGNNSRDHQLAGGFEWEGDSREFLALGEAWVRGERRGGLLMLSFPDGNVLHATWKVSLAKGQAWRVRYALTDDAAAHSTNGLRFTITGTDDQGRAHKLADRVLKPGDRRVYDEEIRLPAAVAKLTFTHDNLGSEVWDVLWILPQGMEPPKGLLKTPAPQSPRTPEPQPAARPTLDPAAIASLRAAVEDLSLSFPVRYRRGEEFLSRLERIEQELPAAVEPAARAALTERFVALRREALVANPLVSAQPVLYVARRQYVAIYHAIDTLYEVGEATEGRYHRGGALKILEAASGKTRTLVEAPEGTIRGPCVHFDGRRVLFAMRRHSKENLHLFEIDADPSTGLRASGDPRQLTFAADVSDFDPIYLPGGDIVFCSTREPKYNMCSQDIGANLYRMGPDGANIHQITKSTLFENQPSLLPDGRVLYKRWEYVDRNFGDAHSFWTVNPDGTNQAVVYGNNTADPAAVYYPRVIPDGTGRLLCILSTHHHNMWGPMAILDPGIAADGKAAILRTWPSWVRGRLSDSPRFNCDGLNPVAPKYETPLPLSSRHFLCSRMTGRDGEMGLYLVDVFGNEVLLHAEEPSCFSPMPLARRPRPPVVPARRDFGGGEGTLYVRNVHIGTHMRGVAPAAAKAIRIVESPEKRGWSPAKWYGQGFMAPGMNWHDFTAKRILGTVPVERDGSAYFAVPSDTFVYFQLLDEDGLMIQSMRSGTVVQPGETTGCVGCHDDRHSTPPPAAVPQALQRPASRISPWQGRPGPFSYVAEVQPVFDRHCVKCHDFGGKGAEKLILAGDRGLFFNASYTQLWRKGYIRALGAGPANVQEAYSWGARGSKLIQVLRKGHQALRLPPEDLRRIATWIDINAPYYPSYYSAYPGNPGGRCPLDDSQLKRLGQITGMNLLQENTFSRSTGPHVSFDRPPLSPCLARLEKDSPAHAEALALICAAADALKSNPRADMPDFRPCTTDRQREQKYLRRREIELRNRQAIRQGTRNYDQDRSAGTDLSPRR